jgi:hypothetical protein
MPDHSHGDVTHDHPDADPGHTHETGTAPPSAAPTTPTPAPMTAAPTTAAVADAGPPPGGLALRLLLTLAGAAAMIVGSFLAWLGAEGFEDAAGSEIEWNVFLTSPRNVELVGFFSSAGLVVIVVALIALLGLALRRGWLTVLAGVLGIAAFVLVLIALYRAEGGIGNVRIGLWLVLAGGLAALIGGLFASRTRVVATTRRY